MDGLNHSHHIRQRMAHQHPHTVHLHNHMGPRHQLMERQPVARSRHHSHHHSHQLGHQQVLMGHQASKRQTSNHQTPNHQTSSQRTLKRQTPHHQTSNHQASNQQTSKRQTIIQQIHLTKNPHNRTNSTVHHHQIHSDLQFMVLHQVNHKTRSFINSITKFHRD